jgi:hypothetical protein
MFNGDDVYFMNIGPDIIRDNLARMTS